MNRIRVFGHGLAVSMVVASGVLWPSPAGGAMVVELREDFSEPTPGDWGVFFSPLDRLFDGESPHTPISDADNDSMGTWGGYYPVGGSTQGGLFFSGAALPGLLIPEGSFWGVDDPDALANGNVLLGAYPSAGGTGEDETGGYLYTAFPSTPIDLSTNSLIQFDAYDGTSQPTAEIRLRLMLRIDSGGTPMWILSDQIGIEGAQKGDINNLPPSGSLFSDFPIVNEDPTALTWTEITAPSDSVLVPVLADDEAPLTLGGSVSNPDLSSVTGFGIYLDTDIQRGDAYGVGVDAIRLQSTVSAVADHELYR